MAYSRRNVTDGITIMNKELYDNLQDGIDDLTIEVSNTKQEVNETKDTMQENISALSEEIVLIDAKSKEAVAIAKGRNRSHVFNDTQHMLSWLSNPENKGLCLVGDNLYIIDVDVPDWWISKVLNTPNEEGYFYEIAPLEVQKVDLSPINEHIDSTKNPHSVTKEQVGLGNVDNTSDTDKPVSTAQQTAIKSAKNDAVGKIVKPWSMNGDSQGTGAIRSHNGLTYRALYGGGGDYPWDSDRWEEVILSNIIEENKSELDYIVEPWHNTVGYSVGDLVSYKGVIYKCISGNTNVAPTITGSTYWTTTHISRIIETIGKVTTVTGEKMSVPSNASGSTALASATFKKGIYLVVCSASIPGGNTIGSRRINLLTTPNTISASLGVSSSSVPLGGITQSLQITTILNVTTDDTTYYLNAQQTSGSTLDDCQGQIRAVRIA